MHSSRGEQNQWLKRPMNPSIQASLKRLRRRAKQAQSAIIPKFPFPPFSPCRSHAMRASGRSPPDKERPPPERNDDGFLLACETGLYRPAPTRLTPPFALPPAL